MENINPISVGELILMGIELASLTSLVTVTLICMVILFVLELQDLCSSILDLFFVSSPEGTNSHTEIITQKAYSSEEDIDNGDERMLSGEVEMVMERLWLFCNQNGDTFQETRGSYQNIATLFDEDEPSVEEVKQAFDVYDENSDGYIDEMELQKVLRRLGFRGSAETECRRMITSYDDNGDGRIDFTEFSKLVENSFC